MGITRCRQVVQNSSDSYLVDIGMHDFNGGFARSTMTKGTRITKKGLLVFVEMHFISYQAKSLGGKQQCGASVS
jgi:hypothetical protein